MPITRAKQAANAANAQLSTGPRSEAGKAISSSNSLRHGLTAKQLVVPADQKQEFEDLQNRMQEEIDPQGVLEIETFKLLVCANWNLHRFRTLEAALMADNLDPLFNDSVTETLDRLYRYAAHHQRAYHKAMAELRTLQTNRRLKDTNAGGNAKEIPALASVNVLLRLALARARHRSMARDDDSQRFTQEAMLFDRFRCAVQNEPKTPAANSPKEDPNAA